MRANPGNVRIQKSMRKQNCANEEDKCEYRNAYAYRRCMLIQETRVHPEKHANEEDTFKYNGYMEIQKTHMNIEKHTNPEDACAYSNTCRTRKVCKCRCMQIQGMHANPGNASKSRGPVQIQETRANIEKSANPEDACK